MEAVGNQGSARTDPITTGGNNAGQMKYGLELSIVGVRPAVGPPTKNTMAQMATDIIASI
ncbi:MAG: hypothetical protein WAO22_10050 [bacterium]